MTTSQVEDVHFVPGSERAPVHESHCQARISATGMRTQRGEALATEALSMARTLLAQHTPRYNHKR